MKYDEKIYVAKDTELYLPLKIEDIAALENVMRNFAAKYLIDVEDVELRVGQQYDYGDVYELWVSAMRPPTEEEIALRKTAARKARAAAKQREQKEYERLKKKFG